MDKIKSNIHRGNKNFVLGISFVVFSLIASVVWGFTYAEDIPPVTTSTITSGTTNTIEDVRPQAPTNLNVLVDGNKVILNWTDNSNNEAGFKIYRGPIWTDIGNVGSNITTFTDVGREAGTYTYRLNAFNGNYSYSLISNDVTVTVGETTTVTNTTVVAPTTITTTTLNTSIPNINSIISYIPNAPSNLSLYGVLSSLSKSISLKWTDNANNEDKFNIERKLSSASAWSYLNLIMGSNLSFYIDEKVTSGVSYDYRVQACLTNVGCSSYATLEKIIIPVVNNILNPNSLAIPPVITTTPAVNTIVNSIVVPVVLPKVPTVTSVDTSVTGTTRSVKIEPSVLPSTTTTISNTGAATTTKEVLPAEIPKQIIENVTDTLNILFKSSEATIGTTTNNGDVKVEQPAPTLAQIAKDEKVKEEIVQLVYQDTNKDGISDYDSKYVYNMDPVKPSPTSIYEGKNITAGEKILLGFDPSKKDLEKVVIEEPTTEAKPEIVVASYKVNEIKLTETKGIELKGRALPNSFITLYIYSTPIMVTVKTDSNGEWQYTMDKELENGNHTVYTATVNNTGNIVAKSTPFTFVKTAEAVTFQDIVPIQVAQAVTVVEKPGFLQSKNIFFVIIGALMMAGVILILIGLLSKKNTQ